MATIERFGTDHDMEFYVGFRNDIKAMYKSIARNKSNNIIPYFSNSPIFSEEKQIYAICINENRFMTVINSDTMLAILLEYGLL